jgi:hypothetical protein
LTNNGLYVGYEEVSNMLMRDFKWASGYWSEEDVLYSIKEVLRLVGARNVFQNTHAFIKIEDGRGNFPKDVILVDTVAFVNNVETIEEALECPDDLQFIPMRWMTDKIHRRFHAVDTNKTVWDYYVKSNLTYTLNNNYIFTNIDSGICCVFYQKQPTDDRGYPLIPNNVSYLKAIAWDIALKCATQMFFWDKMTNDKFSYVRGMRARYVSQAGNSTKIPSLDERAAIKEDRLSFPGDYAPEKNFHLNLYKRQSIA